MQTVNSGALAKIKTQAQKGRALVNLAPQKRKP